MNMRDLQLDGVESPADEFKQHFSNHALSYAQRHPSLLVRQMAQLLIDQEKQVALALIALDNMAYKANTKIQMKELARKAIAEIKGV